MDNETSASFFYHFSPPPLKSQVLAVVLSGLGSFKERFDHVMVPSLHKGAAQHLFASACLAPVPPLLPLRALEARVAGQRESVRPPLSPPPFLLRPSTVRATANGGLPPLILFS